MFNFKYKKGAVFKYGESSSLNKKNVLLSNTKIDLFLNTKKMLLSNTKYVLVSNTENVCCSYEYINTKNRFMV